MMQLIIYQLLFSILLCVNGLAQPVINIEVIVHDHYTDAPLDGARVAVLRDGVVVDSSYTGIDGRTQLEISLTGVNEMRPGRPETFSISENYPNPFKDETQVDITIAEHQTIQAAVYNLLGQRVLSEELNLVAGNYTMNLSLLHLPTGVYFLRFQGREQGTIKLMKIGGDVLNYRGVLSSGNFRVTSHNGVAMPMNKLSRDNGEFTIKAEKDRYASWSMSKYFESDSELAIPLERQNEVVFLVEYYDRLDYRHDLLIAGITNDEFNVRILSPDTLMLKSGVYRIDGETDTTWVEDMIEISSVDTTIVLNASGTIVDIDGNIYKIIKIGEQWWMRENMRTTRYADGADVSGVYAYNNNVSFVENYGRLYTWEAVMNGAVSSNANPSGVQGICPIGWHVPSDEEWKQLEMHLGITLEGAYDIGWRETGGAGKMKSARTEPDPHPRWDSPNTDATNDSRFSALPGGYRNKTGAYYLIGRFGYWWSSTEGLSELRAWYRGLDYGFGGVLRYTSDNNDGLSVRCIKD
jgi:uncharacterized protein (TIGR02145 family)